MELGRAQPPALERDGWRLREPRWRHSAATFLLAQGMTLEDVKVQLGHSTIAVLGG